MLTLTGCGRLNRTATLNQTKHTSGAAAETALQQQLAKQGFPGAEVNCAKSLIVNVGTSTTCAVTGAGTNRLVRFTFSNSSGEIKLTSVKPL
jgi:hypothetical protein